MEDRLIYYCSPTLAGLKTGSIFNIDIKDAEGQVDMINRRFNQKDMYAVVLTKRRDTALVYVYRRKKLILDLNKPQCAELIKKLGYNGDCNNCIEHLKERIALISPFPHEIGLFLSYPVEDVIGFIENKGKNALLCGFRKVYKDKEAAQKQFYMYEKCTRIYSKLFKEGRELDKLVVQFRHA